MKIDGLKPVENVKMGITELIDNTLSTGEMELSDSVFVFDHRIALVICVYLFIPAATVMIIRDWYMPSRTPKCISGLGRFTLAYLMSASGLACFLATYLEFDMLLYGKLYINGLYFLAAGLIVLNFNCEKKRELKLGIMTTYFGTSLSYISIVLLNFYGKSEIPLITYHIGLVIFALGTLVIFIKIVTKDAMYNDDINFKIV